MSMQRNVTKRAIELSGGSRALADVLGITRQAIEQWVVIPPKHVLAVERLSGISRYELRPDIYGAPPAGVLGNALSGAAA